MLDLNRFKKLKSRDLTLRKRFLKWDQDRRVFGRPATDEIRAYCVLIHAEIEAYIEQVARDGIERSKNLLREKNVANGVLFSLVASAHNLFDDDVIDPNKRIGSERYSKPKSKSEWVELCGAQGHQVIGDNNGIREENLLKMFRPLGIDIGALDRTWLNDMTKLGVDRGNIAHNTMQIQQIPNVTDLSERVDRIIEGCGQLREAMRETCKTSVPAHVALADPLVPAA